MIEAKELRIGNFVLLDGKHTASVIGITGTYITTENPYNVYTDGTTGDNWLANTDFIQPIPLSPEILINAGFEKGCLMLNINENFFLGFDKHLYLQYERQWQVDYVCDRINFENIKYLHQLQNLYFDLKGQELKLKP